MSKLIEETLKYMDKGKTPELYEAKVPKKGTQYAKMSSSLSNKRYDTWEKTYKKFLKKGKTVSLESGKGSANLRAEGDILYLTVDRKLSTIPGIRGVLEGIHAMNAGQSELGDLEVSIPLSRGDTISRSISDIILALYGRKHNKFAGFHPAKNPNWKLEKLQQVWVESLELDEIVLEYMKSLQKTGNIRI